MAVSTVQADWSNRAAVCNKPLGSVLLTKGPVKVGGLLRYMYIVHFKHCEGMQSATQLDLILRNTGHSTHFVISLLL